MKAVILAGGFGKRLRPLTEKLPKPMLPVADKPILYWQLKWLKHHGIRDVVLCVGYLREKVQEKIEDGRRYGVKVSYVVEEEPLGTGGALMNAHDALSDEEVFLMINGDILTDLNPLQVASAINEAVGAIALVPLPSPYGIVNFDSEGKIRAFVEKPKIKGSWINAGVYAFTQEIFNYLPQKGDVERTAFPRLAEEGKLRAATFPDSFWISIDSHKDLEEASKRVPNVPVFKE